MSQDFYRVVEGYNMPFWVEASGSVARNGTITVNAPAGPGKVEQIGILIDKVADEKLRDDQVTLVIDGFTIFGYYISHFCICYDPEPFYGPVSGFAHGTYCTILQMVRNLDYRSSLSLSVKNLLSPDPSTYLVMLWGRMGF